MVSKPIYWGVSFLQSIKPISPLSAASAVSHLLPPPSSVCRLPPTLPPRVPFHLRSTPFTSHLYGSDLIPLLRFALLIDPKQEGLKTPRPSGCGTQTVTSQTQNKNPNFSVIIFSVLSSLQRFCLGLLPPLHLLRPSFSRLTLSGCV